MGNIIKRRLMSFLVDSPQPQLHASCRPIPGIANMVWVATGQEMARKNIIMVSNLVP